MGSTRRSFTPEYKEQSVAFVLDGGRRDCGSKGVSGLITLSLMAWRERCRDDTFCVNLRPRLAC